MGLAKAMRMRVQLPHFAVTSTVSGPASGGLMPILAAITQAGLPTPRGAIVADRTSGPAGTGAAEFENGQAHIQIDPLGPRVVDHELGHAFDYLNMNDLSRQRFRGIMHDTRPWGDIGARNNGEPNPPREQFAEAYRILAQHPTIANSQRQYDHFQNNMMRGYNFDPSYYQLRKIRALIQSLG